MSKLDECKSAIEEDKLTFGIACVNKFVQWEEVVVKHLTDAGRLEKESHDASLAIVNATILHMGADSPYGDVLEGGTLVTKGGVISAVGPAASVEVPSGAVVINANQGACTLLYSVESVLSLAACRIRPTRLHRHACALERIQRPLPS